jgi:glycosyl transferase family 61
MIGPVASGIEKALYKRIRQPETIEYRKPKGLDPNVDTFDSLRSLSVAEGGVAAIPNGYACGEGNTYVAVLASDREPIGDLCFGDTSAHGHDLPHSTLIDETVGFVADRPSWINPYFHWMFQVLPRIQLLRRSGISIAKYVMNERRFPFQYETIERLGVDKTPIVEVASHFHIQARELVVPSEVPVLAPTWVCKFLRRKFLKPTAARDGDKRLYISRATAPRGRTVANETQLKAVLADFGFTEFVPDQVSVAEQARIFSSAQFVVGPHGSALTNLVFCSPGTKVVELFAPKYVHPVYWMLSSQCSLDYYYLVGRGTRPRTWSTFPEAPKEFGLDSIDVDTEELVALLKLAGL